MFPDRAALYVVAIEDRQYKDFKIHCKSPSDWLLGFFIYLFLRVWGGKRFRGPRMCSCSRGHTCCASGVYL